MPLQVEWNNEQGVLPIHDSLRGLLERCLQQAAQSEGVATGEVCVTLVDDASMQQLNRTYRQQDRPTDVLSFPLGDDLETLWPENSGIIPPLGDIVISVPRASEQARAYGHSFARELGFLVTHGFLHLLGYDHDDEDSESDMFRKQETALAAVGLTRDSKGGPDGGKAGE